ncbi:MAG TPA: T9SS type A sorting domain-containing protein, partial [Bacteroidia bacterium]|nr:T9SS type A sorting domain-containing protein [Bacteroidia bacterium]
MNNILKYMLMSTALLAFLNFPAVGQSYQVISNRCLGGSGGEGGGSIVYCGNYEFMIGCFTTSGVSGTKTVPLCNPTNSGMWTFKTDTTYSDIWQMTIDGYGVEGLTEFSINLNNRNLNFSCGSMSDSSCDKSENNKSFPNHPSDYWVGACDSSGVILWEKTLGGISSDDYPIIFQSSASDYYVIGTSTSPVGGDKTVANYGMDDYWMVKLDSIGHIKWDKVYGGSLRELHLNDDRLSMVETDNNALVFMGTTNSPADGNVSDTSRGTYDLWVVKIDTSGAIIWDKRFGGNGPEYANRIINTPDKGFMLCGQTRSDQGFDVSESKKGLDDVWIVKIDSLGNKQFDKRYGGNNHSYGIDIANAPGGGYWVGGFTDSDSLFDVSQPGYGFWDYWLIRLDSLGTKIWDGRYGGSGYDHLNSIAVLPDSSVVLCGVGDDGTSPVKTDSGYGGGDMYLVRIKYVDNTSGIAQPKSISSFQLYPNPAQDAFTLVSDALKQREVTISIYNLPGELVYREKVTPNTNSIRVPI